MAMAVLRHSKLSKDTHVQLLLQSAPLFVETKKGLHLKNAMMAIIFQMMVVQIVSKITDSNVQDLNLTFVLLSVETE